MSTPAVCRQGGSVGRSPLPLLDSQGCPGRQPPRPSLDKCKGVGGGSVGVSLCWVPAVPWHPPGHRNQSSAGLLPKRQPVSVCLRALPRAWLRCQWAVRAGGDSRPPRSLALGSAGPGAGPGQPEGGFPLRPQEGPVFSHEQALWDAGPGPCVGYVPAAPQLQHQRGHRAAAGLHRGPRARTQVLRLLGPQLPSLPLGHRVPAGGSVLAWPCAAPAPSPQPGCSPVRWGEARAGPPGPAQGESRVRWG